MALLLSLLEMLEVLDRVILCLHSLFSLAMEYLFRIFGELHKTQGFHFNRKCKIALITQLIFVDDLLFYKDDPESVALVVGAFQKFFKALGLSANAMKSNVYLAGVDSVTHDAILNSLNMSMGEFPFTYLGVPPHSKKLTSVEYRGLEDKITHKLKHWFAKYAL